MILVLDSGALTRLAERSDGSAALVRALRSRGLWPPLVPAAVLVESLTGDPARDAATNLLLRGCDVVESLSVRRARRAARMRSRARRGSAVDAIVVATAEPGGTVLTEDVGDIRALAAESEAVRVLRL